MDAVAGELGKAGRIAGLTSESPGDQGLKLRVERQSEFGRSRLGAKRQATALRYRVELQMTHGNGPALEPADHPPKYRSITPDQANIPYEKASRFDPRFDVNLVGVNGHSSLMGEFLPTVHDLSRAEFEALGSQVTAGKVPIWQ